MRYLRLALLLAATMRLAPLSAGAQQQPTCDRA